ncbi:hypothetical protein DASC09_038770 [Saccharomycopsis crataegensis]|uniref:Protein sym1 n=1 Tax=Saccharomycopsis crataegensis TaxID=43959 RepID=A0AAV5QP11_9ASCO|nr:hypothetical protein DASC09_038770 [Saccharomycopsis crataegensis]
MSTSNKKFDGPIELDTLDIATPNDAGSPYAKTTFQPYSPIIDNNPSGFASISGQLSNANQPDIEFSMISGTAAANAINISTPTHRRHQRILFVSILFSLSGLTYMIHYYENLKIEYPPLAIIVIIGSLSSVIAQLINQFYRRHYSLSHVAKFLIWGCINGVLTSLWIDMLFVQFDHTVARVMVDQLIGSPFFQLVFLVLNAIWDNNNDIRTYLRVNYLKSLKLSYLIWPCFSILSFSILPPEFIFPCNCLVNLIWNVILSFIA